MIELVRPRAFLPIHGTLHHLTRHAELAKSLGVGRVLVAENGQSVLFSPRAGLTRGDAVTQGRVAVAPGGEELPADVLKKRAELARSGVVSVAVSIDERGELIGPPSVVARGVPAVDGDDAALRDIAREIVSALARVRGWRGVDLDDEVRRAVRRRVTDLSGARPLIDVHRVELPR